MGNNLNISIFGLGYVGLPLAIKLSNYFNVLGFDKNKKVITPTIKTKRIAPPAEMIFLFDKICINLDCPSKYKVQSFLFKVIIYICFGNK